MASPANQHLEGVVRRLNNMSLAETRNLYAQLRSIEGSERDDMAVTSAFLPHFGVTIGEVCLITS